MFRPQCDDIIENACVKLMKKIDSTSEVDTFLESISARVKKLDVDRQADIQLEIMQLVTKYERDQRRQLCPAAASTPHSTGTPLDSQKNSVQLQQLQPTCFPTEQFPLDPAWHHHHMQQYQQQQQLGLSSEWSTGDQTSWHQEHVEYFNL